MPTFSDGLRRLGDRTPAAAIDAEIIVAAALLGACRACIGARELPGEARFEFDNRAKIPFAHRIARDEIKQQSQSWCVLHLLSSERR